MVPAELKVLNAVSLHKEGREKMGNLRPVGLTFVVEKMLSYVIKETLTIYIENNNSCEHTLMNGNSDLINLIEIFEDVTV